MSFIRLICLMGIVLLLACEPLDSGDPPQFDGVTLAAAVNENQIELRWEAASDDTLEPEELAYAIWFSDEGSIDPDSVPSIVTGEGALSYNLVGLAAETDYEILVRAVDRGTNYSENIDTRTVATPANEAGNYSSPQVFATDDNPSQLLTGRVLSGTRDDLAVVAANRIGWYLSQADGTVTRLSRDFDAGETILEAHLIPVRAEIGLDDLLISTGTGLTFYRRDADTPVNEVPFETGETPFAGALPVREFSVVAPGRSFEVLAYLDRINVVRFYTFDEENEAFTLQSQDQLDGNPRHHHMADLDDDGVADQVFLNDQGLLIAHAVDETYTFQTPELIDTYLPADDSESELFARDGDGDGLVDLYIFERNEIEDTTLLRLYRGEGEGRFEEPVESDYGFAFYRLPRFTDASGDGFADLVMLQTSANNLVVYRGGPGQGTFNGLFGYLGGNGEPVLGVFGDLDGRLGRDAALITQRSNGDFELALMFDNR